MNFQETAPFSLKDGTYLPQTRHLRTFNSAPFGQRHAVLTFSELAHGNKKYPSFLQISIILFIFACRN